MAIDTMTTRKGCILLAVLIMLAPMARGQRYSDWRIYRASDGLAETACVSVTMGINEKIIVKHINAESVSELNGYSIRSFASPEFGRNRVYQSSGGQLGQLPRKGSRNIATATGVYIPFRKSQNYFTAWRARPSRWFQCISSNKGGCRLRSRESEQGERWGMGFLNRCSSFLITGGEGSKAYSCRSSVPPSLT